MGLVAKSGKAHTTGASQGRGAQNRAGRCGALSWARVIAGIEQPTLVFTVMTVPISRGKHPEWDLVPRGWKGDSQQVTTAHMLGAHTPSTHQNDRILFAHPLPQ